MDWIWTDLKIIFMVMSQVNVSYAYRLLLNLYMKFYSSISGLRSFFTLAVARGGGKFKPKAKTHPRNETSTSLPSAPSTATEEKPVTLSSTSLETEQYAQPVAENKLTNEDGLSVVTLEIVGTREPSKDNECSFPDKRSSESIKSSSQLVTGEDAGSRDALQSEVAMCDSNSVWHSSIGMLSSEVET